MSVLGRFHLGGRVAVVTGAGGLLGREFTKALVEAGARVAALDVKEDGSGMDSGNVLQVEADVTNRASLEAALERISGVWEAPSVLVNNAGLDSPPGAPAEENGPFETYPESSWDKVMSVNVKGVLLCSQVFGGAMAKGGRGSIINISSIYGMVAPDQRIYEFRRQEGAEFYKPVAYAASKSALFNLTRYMAGYWAGRGVRANCLTLAGVFNGQDARFLEAYCPKVPLGRMAGACEYNGALVFLASEASSYMTGSNLVVDGGYTAL